MSRAPSAERTLHALALGAWLAGARDAAGLTQEQLATRAGVSQPALSRLERGTHSPDVYQLHVLATALGTTTAEALTAVEETEAAALDAARAMLGERCPATAEGLLQVLGREVLAALVRTTAHARAAGVKSGTGGLPQGSRSAQCPRTRGAAR